MNPIINDESLNPIADIISNLLGILIVVIMIAALAAGSMENSADKREYDRNDEFEFETTKREWFPPWSEFFIIAHDRISLWDLEQNIKWFKKAGFLSKVSKTQKIENKMGSFRLDTIDHQWDIDTYRLCYSIKWEWFIKENKPFEEIRINEFIDQRIIKRRELRTVPAFFVYPSGMKLFSYLYKKLLKHNIPFRWDTVSPGKVVCMYRDMDQFNAENYYFH